MSSTMESTESNATGFCENSNATMDLDNGEIAKNFNSTSPSKSAVLIESEITRPSENQNLLCDDVNLKTTVDKNTGEKNDNNVDDEICDRPKKKYKIFLDSDSEEEENSTSSFFEKLKTDSKLEDFSAANGNNVSEKSDFATKIQNSRRFIDSDSDEDSAIVRTNVNSNDQKECEHLDQSANAKSSKPKFRTIIDSDSADEDEPDPPDSLQVDDHNEASFENKNKTKSKPKLNSILDSESEYDDSSHRTAPTVKKKVNRKKSTKAKSKQKSKSDLVDTDSEEDSQRQNVDESFNEASENSAAGKESGKNTKKRSGSVRAAKDEAMRQIHSETQRLIRNSAISLPYHVPKQRTLQDFLNRKKVIPLPEGLSTTLKVKMSSEIVSKALEEKEKEAEAFYKSSDSEEEEITCTPLSSNLLDETMCPVDQPSIEETQKNVKNDLQNVHNKKEIIQQGGAEIGVPRKLFIDEPLEKEISVESKEGDDDDSMKLDPRKKTKETKQGMREGNAPRKLFPSDYDEGVDSPPKDEVIASEDTTDSGKRREIEVDQEAVDEGIHSLEKNNESSDDFKENEFVSKMTDSELSEILEEEKINEKNDANPSNELLNISETPFISNKEYAKLNEREKSSKIREDRIDNSEIAEDPAKLVFGDVIGLPPPDFDGASPGSKTLKTRKRILSTFSKTQPKLRGSPGMMIDLTNDSKPDKEGIQSLRDRFFRHSTINKPKEVQSSVSIMRTEQTPHGLKVVEEILPYKIPVGGLTEKELQKPGAKYKRLKMDLIQKMAIKRGEEWELEAQRERKNRVEEEGEDEEEDEEKSEKEEEEINELDEEEGMTESEPEVDDMPVEKRKKRKLREFADEEAEVSLEEDEEDEDEDVEDEEDNISLRVENDEDTQENCSDTESLKKPRRTRIVKSFEDDSNSQPDRPFGTDGGGKILERTKTDVDMFAPENDGWSSDNEVEFPPSQILPHDRADGQSQLCKTPLTAINILRFVSPITQLTALNTSCNSPKESPADISLESSRIFGSFSDKTPISFKESPISCDKDKRSNLQKKLFEDTTGAVNDEELMGLCSGKFTGIENEAKDSIDPMEISSGERVTETQLLGLCSGTFTSQILDLDGGKDEKNINENSQDIRLTMDGDSDDSCDDATSREIKKSKYGSLRVKSSSEDENSEDENASKNVKKRKVQKLDLSDDEESSDDEENEEEVLENDEKYVDYDSEENEVVVPKKDIKKVAATFLEAEAELSESEWGSEDEDEKGLDRLEFEEADEEEIDENQMRDQLGKIHMRRVQDDDQREVRMLQELLFDDGDLHTDGSGRERKFKWKNIDKLGDDDKFGSRDEDGGENGDMVDDETDLAWLSEKIEREKFLEGKTKTNVDEVIEELAADSQVFTLGMKALKRTKSTQSSQKEQPEPVITKPMASRTILDLVDTQSFGSSRTIIRKAVSRGSFLARGDECLARMAVHLKETDTTVIKKSNPRNFVFGQINPSDEEPTKINENDRTGEISLDTLKGNKRKSTGGLTPRLTKKAKVERVRPVGKKLY